MSEDWIDLTKRLPGLRGNRIHALPATAEPELRSALDASGFTTCVLEGERVTGEQAFFAEAARALGLPSYFGHNWDALNDALGDLVSGETPRIAIVWRDADASLAKDAQSVIDAVLAFEAAAWEGFDTSEQRPVQLEVFLLGRAAGFSR
jgi:RNAse (barnase) inhibitor barstar